MKLTDHHIIREGKKSQCPICEKWYFTAGLPSHFHRTHNPHAKLPINEAWNKGKTKYTDECVAKYSKKVSISLTGRPGQKPSAETKAKTSASMKQAHAEGRAHNIGNSRWNNEPSYPEKFFMSVICNEFDDKEYVREHPFGRFSLDFAWIHKKKCIEIDGEQHQRFLEYQERDKRKDDALNLDGWKVLRINWKEMYANPKHWISVAKIFIHN